MVLFAGVVPILAAQPGGMAAALPVLGALAIGAVRLQPMLQLIYNGWAQVSGSRQSLVDVATTLGLPLPDDGPASTPLPFEREIVFDRIAFHYPSGAGPVLESISFTVPKGARVSISGKTGSEKSTFDESPPRPAGS